MRPAFGVTRHVERRESNATITAQSGDLRTMTKTLYEVAVTRVFILWIVVWTHETEHG